MKNLLGVARKYHIQVVMVDTDGMDFGSRIWMHEKHFLSVQSLGQQGYIRKQEYQPVHQVLYDQHIVNIIRLHTVFLVNQNLLLENIQTLELPPMQTTFHKLYGISPLMGLTYMMQQFKHDLLVNSKQLTSIKLSKLVIYKSMQVFSIIPFTTCNIFCSNQTPINLFQS